MLTVPLQAIASQSVSVTLGGQACQINVYQKTFYTDNDGASSEVQVTPLFLDLYVNNALIIGGVLCLNGVRIVRDAYLGFVGDLAFYDTQGVDDPVYTGLGARWQLVYFAESELAEGSV